MSGLLATPTTPDIAATATTAATRLATSIDTPFISDHVGKIKMADAATSIPSAGMYVAIDT